MAQTAGPQMIVYLHCRSILCLLCGRNALVTKLFGRLVYLVILRILKICRTYNLKCHKFVDEFTGRDQLTSLLKLAPKDIGNELLKKQHEETTREEIMNDPTEEIEINDILANWMILWISLIKNPSVISLGKPLLMKSQRLSMVI